MESQLAIRNNRNPDGITPPALVINSSMTPTQQSCFDRDERDERDERNERNERSERNEIEAVPACW